MLTTRHLTLLAAALAAACSTDDPTGLSDEVAVDVMLDDDAGLRILAVYPTDEMTALAPGGSPELGWQLVLGSEVLASGTIHDPRVIQSETGSEIRNRFGSTSLRLPAQAGDLLFLEGEVEIARTTFDPARLESQLEVDEEPAAAPQSGVGTTRSPLMRKGDLRGKPARIMGNLDRGRAVDLLILAEGYTDGQLARFRRDASQISRGFRSIMSRQRKRFAGQFNVWVQNVRSRSTGIDDPATHRRADTAFDISFGTGDLHRCTWFNTAGGEEAARALGRRAGADITVVLANTTGYGGCANNGLFVVTRSSDAPWVVAHELGHALLGLADEYDYGTCRHDPAPNVTFSSQRARIPWRGAIAASTPLPTPQTQANARVIGAFTGAEYCRTGAFRPQLNCMMRELHHNYCRVCLVALDRHLRTLNRTGQKGGGTPGGSACGDGACTADETVDTCPADCDGGGGGGGEQGCGNGACDGDETDASCPGDCGCAASDCGLAPYGCYCDPSCTATGDCCSDACSACGSC